MLEIRKERPPEGKKENLWCFLFFGKDDEASDEV
jgi:hypothetical protein